MHISLTPELESRIKKKVESGLYNNASEVIREALRFMETHKELVYRMKLDTLRKELNLGEMQAQRGEFIAGDMESIIHEANANADG